MFLQLPSQCRTHGTRFSLKEKTTAKWGKSLNLTVEASETMDKDGAIDDLVVGLNIVSDEPTLHLSTGTVVKAKPEKNEKNGVAA